jgi:exopolysaccharide production protein ExoZ
MLNSLQILRGLAAWAVVFNHINQSYFMGKTDSLFWGVFKDYGGFGVDIFFVLSGFVMALVSNKYLQSGITFGVNRAFRLIPIYWFYTLLLVISILVLPSGTYLTSWEGLSLLKSLFFVPNINPNGYGYYPTLYVGWTLIYELFFYVIFSIVLTLKLPKPSIICSIILVLIAYVYRWDPFLGHSSLLLIEFSLGILIFEYHKAIKLKNIFLKAIFPIVVLTSLACIFLYIDKMQFSKFFCAGLLVYIFILSEKFFSKQLKLFHFLKVVGDQSYSTYLNHIIIIGWAYYLFGDLKSTPMNYLVVVTICISIMVVSRFSYIHIETSKYISHFKLMIINVLTKNGSNITDLENQKRKG